MASTGYSSNVNVVMFLKDDPESPYNWSERRKMVIVLMGIVAVVNSTLGSALPSNAIQSIASEFRLSTSSENPALVLPISIYLVGYVLGPLLFGPLSETYGRKPPILLTFAGYTISTLGCALAPNWASLIIFRLIAGVCASAPLTVVGGIFADIYQDPRPRGRAVAIFMASIVCAPLIAPVMSGFLSTIGWRWTFWAALIITGASWVLLGFLPETYGPIILKHRANRLRKAATKSGDDTPQIYAPIELEKKGIHQFITVVLARPLAMLVSEMIVMASCLYLSIAYAIFYMYFQTYPIVFKGIYGMSPGVSGLMFLPIGAGACISLCIFFLYDSFLDRSRRVGKPWTNKEESRRLPLACLGGPLYIVSLLWLGWTARSDIHWIVPCLAGIPFGMGILLIFMALLNYLGDAYGIYAASAMAAASFCRSIFGAALPFAANSMYKSLGIGWATSLLALISLAMSAMPFAFIHYGDSIRARSAFCQMLKKKSSVGTESGE